MKLPIGIDNFKELVNEKYDFIDKSLFIKDVLEDSAKVLLITRPRRFGKTINMSMLEYFLSLNKKTNQNLFQNLKISQNQELCKKFQNQHPVIFVTFKNVISDNYESAYKLISNIISNLYSEFKDYLYDSLEAHEKHDFDAILFGNAPEAKIYFSIERLSFYLSKKSGKSVFILIDEYDSAVHSGFINGYYDKVAKLIRGIFGAALKGNDSLHKAIVTGITKISSESMFSGINNFDSYSVLDEGYSNYFGFIETEVKDFIRKLEYKINFDNITSWYNGYTIGQSLLYNPWSIIKCLKNKGILSPYWVNTSQNLLIKNIINQGRRLKASWKNLFQVKFWMSTLIIT